WRNGDLGRYVGYLPQDVALFDGTVTENICRFDENATSDAILKAARIAGVHDLILRLPDGYATRIGAGGMSLSAGQRQRVGLARALFGDPFLVVLDEPNANLDTEGEQALTRAIQALRASKSIVIVISHRPSALAALDMALVLYEGKAIAFGRRDEVGGTKGDAPSGSAGRSGIMSGPRERHDNVLEHPRHEPQRDVGPQGAALILELQRLRQSFERDNWREVETPPRRVLPKDAR
ncbi:hypothetical protein KXV85_001049, partial [Aspergillus fumigatus]